MFSIFKLLDIFLKNKKSLTFSVLKLEEDTFCFDAMIFCWIPGAKLNARLFGADIPMKVGEHHKIFCATSGPGLNQTLLEIPDLAFLAERSVGSKSVGVTVNNTTKTISQNSTFPPLTVVVLQDTDSIDVSFVPQPRFDGTLILCTALTEVREIQ